MAPVLHRGKMPCYHPLTLYRSKKGPDPKTGKWALTGLTFGIPEKPETIPCGQCIGCRLERSRQWAIRCVHEASLHAENSFITLTYSDDNLTWGLQRPTLYSRDLQLFLKKLRKKFDDRTIRFFACGEYGGRTGRPHYHACLFGLDFQDKKLHNTKNGNKLYTSRTLDNIWSHGNTLIGSVTFDSAAYVARYIMDKKLGKTANYYTEQAIEPEFVRMSRRPGLGKNWLTKFESDIFPRDRLVIRGGIQTHPPKYYSNQYEIAEPIKYEKIKIKRKLQLQSNPLNYSKTHLQTREIIKAAQTKTLTRSN